MTTAGNYSDDDFWQKLKSFALKAGKEVIEKALWLYYAAQRPETPAWAKAIIFGALAYFILPLDAIPDVIPVAGFSDDLGALAAAIGMVSMYITADIKVRTAQKLQQWFT
ncbi:YkvA family protein [Iodobacter arcticus]|uniref:YkvA family protein n=1 Tax=Iodobacter arcticus TaxID=590593 RepID=A0ABW2R3B0_9NEIS